MKKKKMYYAIKALRPVKVQRIANKELREVLLANELTLLEEQRKYEQKAKDLETTLLGGYEKDRAAVEQLKELVMRESDRSKRDKMKADIDSHADLFDAVRRLHAALRDLGEESITLKRIDKAAFMEEMKEQEFELGLIEAVFPMFNA